MRITPLMTPHILMKVISGDVRLSACNNSGKADRFSIKFLNLNTLRRSTTSCQRRVVWCPEDPLRFIRNHLLASEDRCHDARCRFSRVVSCGISIIVYLCFLISLCAFFLINLISLPSSSRVYLFIHPSSIIITSFFLLFLYL